MLNIKSCRGKR